MKNKSLQHPFPTFQDQIFDGNHDGKLDTVETIFRDAHLNEMKQRAEENKKMTVTTEHMENKKSHKTGFIILSDAWKKGLRQDVFRSS